MELNNAKNIKQMGTICLRITKDKNEINKHKESYHSSCMINQNRVAYKEKNEFDRNNHRYSLSVAVAT